MFDLLLDKCPITVAGKRKSTTCEKTEKWANIYTCVSCKDGDVTLQ